MAIVISLLIGFVIGYAIAYFIGIHKNAKLMIDISNESKSAKEKAKKRWGM